LNKIKITKSRFESHFLLLTTSTWIGMPAWTTAECWIRMGRQSSGRGGGVRTRMMMSLREW
jgi:hypothetical protein